MKANTRTVVFCPECGIDFTFIKNDDTFSKTCKDCFKTFSGHMENGEAIVDSVEESDAIACLFRLRDLFFVTGPYLPFENDEHRDYFFHSHTCPVNITRATQEIYDAEEGDPHGIFRFVASIPVGKLPKFDRSNYNNLESVFRLFNTIGLDAPSRYQERGRGLIPGLAEMQRVSMKTKAPKG